MKIVFKALHFKNFFENQDCKDSEVLPEPPDLSVLGVIETPLGRWTLLPDPYLVLDPVGFHRLLTWSTSAVNISSITSSL